jgi:hypothetical protein
VSAPALDDDAPALDDDAPALDDDAPALDDDAPALDDDAPALDDDAPALDDDAPALDDDAGSLSEPHAASVTANARVTSTARLWRIVSRYPLARRRRNGADHPRCAEESHQQACLPGFSAGYVATPDRSLVCA